MNRFDFSTLYRPFCVAMLCLTIFSCDGGGCSSCDGCGVTPIRGGFPIADRIDNSAQVRLSPTGIQFIEDNMSTIVSLFVSSGLDFPVERTGDGGTGTVCLEDSVRGDGASPCVAHIEIHSVDLTPVEGTDTLRARVRLIVQSRDTSAGNGEWDVNAGIETCDISIDTNRGGRTYVSVDADLHFEATPQPARQGYTRLRVTNATLAEGIEGDDYNLGGGIFCEIGSFLDGLFNLLPGLLAGQIEGLLNDTLNEQLCQSQGEFGCPTGTCASDGDPGSTCYFDSTPASPDSCTVGAECVPILLGMDGEGDLGGTLLGGFSPGTHAWAQFLLASGGPGEAVNNGMSLFFYGGFRGTDRTFMNTPAHNSCVPTLPPPAMPDIARLNSFRGSPERPEHVGFGIAEAYMDYAGYGMFDSGMLCLGAGTRLSQQLSTGLVSALIMSLPDLPFPDESAAMTIAVRPQQPPDFTIGTGGATDPLLQIAMPQMQLDFYVWSTERYIRFMTFQADLEIGIDLSVESAQIVPTIQYINANNGVVTNSELLSERPDALAGVLATLFSSLAGTLGSGISPVDLPAIMGFNLVVPDGGITRVTEGDDNFLGIFANLELAGPMPITAPVETRLSVSDLSIDRASMSPETWNAGAGNTAWLELTAQGPLAVEFEHSYRIDGGVWSPWTTDDRIQIDDDVLLLQARHQIEARSRVVGEPASVDATPATAELVVDILAPQIEVARTVDGVEVDASDVITPPDDLEYRFNVDGTWTEWGSTHRIDVAHDDSEILVEVRDESGNVGRSSAALIRGLPDPSAESCGCRAPGSGRPLPLGLLFLVAIGGVALWRRRTFRRASRAAAPIALAALLTFAAGCDCGGPIETLPCNGMCRFARPPADPTGSVCCDATNMCADYDVNELCDPGYECAESNIEADEECNVSCTMCMVRPALDPGTLATYLDVVVNETTGIVYISGYNPGYAAGDDSVEYGDLVFGAWTGGDVQWEIVEGAPTMPITNDPNGWRGGVSDPGPDVGRWTSMVYDGTTFFISYYDVSNTALKMAVGTPGDWTTHTIDDAGDSGRYSSMVLANGIPSIAYLRMQESTAAPGTVESHVMVATANMAVPSGPTDWTITTVNTGVMPCRAGLCDTGTCLESGQCVTPTADCADCGSGEVCFNGSCAATIGANYVEDLPPANGLYTALAVQPTGNLALVFYDRTSGNIYGASHDGTTWGAPFWIDGYLSDEPFVGDCGQGADLEIDSTGTWHVAYIDGAEELLRYAQVDAGGTVTAREVVDDGSTLDGTTRHPDGRHIIGDDASIEVLLTGEVHIVYQDATSQHAVEAVRPVGGGPFTIARIDTEGSTGYWIEQEYAGTGAYAVTWWRSRDARVLLNGTRVLER